MAEDDDVTSMHVGGRAAPSSFLHALSVCWYLLSVVWVIILMAPSTPVYHNNPAMPLY